MYRSGNKRNYLYHLKKKQIIKKYFYNDPFFKKIIKAKRKDKGFELLEKVEMPKIFNNPEKKVETLKDIWFGKEINEVRNSHLKCNGMNIDICKNCTVKDVYQWE